MALPKISVPLFPVVLPSNGKSINLRPFTVKEEKILLIARESGDPKQNLLAIRQVINNCLQDDLTVSDLSTVDLEYILITLRAKSVDNVVEFMINDPDTKEKITLRLDLAEISVTRHPEHTNIIPLNEEWSLIMRYPSFDEFETLLDSDTIEDQFEIIKSCLDQLVSDDESHNLKESTKEELESFINDLTSEDVQKIKKFFETLPKLRHELKYLDSNGKEKTFVIEGLQSFFM